MRALGELRAFVELLRFNAVPSRVARLPATFWNFPSPPAEYHTERMQGSLTEESDSDLLRRASGGSEEAFVTLYRRHQGRVFRFALRMSGDEATAEEVVQEVFLTVIRGPVRYEPARATFGAWLLGVARNHVLRILDSQPRTACEAETPERETADTSVDALAALLARESSEALRRAVLSLPATYREVLALCDLEELDYAEAARALGCSLGTIRSRLHRARNLLAAKLIAAGSNGCTV
jgi:RNA polymerase sigma-70 factor (ECF subfamily)